MDALYQSNTKTHCPKPSQVQSPNTIVSGPWGHLWFLQVPGRPCCVYVGELEGTFQLWNVLCSSHSFTIWRPTMKNHFSHRPYLSVWWILEFRQSRQLVKRHSPHHLYWVLNHEHQLFLVFEVKLQVYWGHPESTGSFPLLWNIWVLGFSWATGSFNAESESHHFLYFLQGQAQPLVNICWFDLLQGSKLTVA